MNTIRVGIAMSLMVIASVAFGHGDDDPLLSKLMIDQLEGRENDSAAFKADLWLGKDLHKVWFKSEYQSVDSETEKGEMQALYSSAISPYWDLQIGWRHDFQLDFETDQDWLAVGLRGLAPYFFDVDAALFVGDGGATAFRLQAEYELLLTQRWVLSPELELNAYGQNIESRGIGSGLANAEFGLRLAYHIRREIAPYLGYNWERRFGNSADYAEAAGEDTRESTWVAGLKFWY